MDGMGSNGAAPAAAGAYGAPKAGVDFDPVTFVKKPVTILRILSWIFAIIVFAVPSNSTHKHVCYYNDDNSVCGFSIFVGVFAFLACSALIVADVMFDNISSVDVRRKIVIGDLGFSGVWAFFYFVNFCNVINAWGKTNQPLIVEAAGSKPGAIIAFSFFSLITFAGLTFFAYRKFRAGVSEPFATPNDFGAPGMDGGQGGYAPYAGNSAPSDPYQPPPFGGQNGAPSY